LEGGVSSPNLDAIEGHKYNWAIVPNIEYYYTKYNSEPTINYDEQVLVKQDKVLPGDLGGSNGG
jgi:hypothetical protein